MQVGDLQVTPVLDGRFELPATLFFPKTYEDDWAPHRQFLNDDGMLPGVQAADVTDLVFTHLHFDHIGWASEDGRPVFPNATYRCHRKDWEFFLSPDLPELQTGKIMGAQVTPSERLDPIADHVEAWDGDGPVTNLSKSRNRTRERAQGERSRGLGEVL